MENLKKLLDSVQTEIFTVSKTKTGEKLQQTQSNNLKKRLLDAIAKDIAEICPYIYRAEKGYLLEIANSSVADGISKDSDGSGAITVEINCVIKGLDCNAEIEGECFADKQAEKQKQAQEKAEAKKRKVEADAKARAERKKGVVGE